MYQKLNSINLVILMFFIFILKDTLNQLLENFEFSYCLFNMFENIKCLHVLSCDKLSGDIIPFTLTDMYTFHINIISNLLVCNL